MPIDFEPNITGWRYDHEDFNGLKGNLESVQTIRALREVEFTAPEEMDCRKWHRIENQGNMGSCVGSSGSSIVEQCLKFATGDVETQLSKWWSYRKAQIHGGISGDSGANLNDMLWVAKNLGVPRESTVPYPSRYSREIPNIETATVEAKQFIVQTAIDIHTYEDAFDFLSKGIGAIQIGIQWPGDWRSTDGWLNSYRGGSGGHALMVGGYLKDKDTAGKNWLIMPNTWSKNWGDNGYAYLSSQCWDGMARSRYFQAIGYSDMKTIKPRIPKVQM